MKLLKSILVLALLCIAPLAVQAQSASATFAWDASVSGNIVNYSVYVGTSSGVYNVSTNAFGNVLTGTVSNLQPGVTYYVVATCKDSSGLESVFSNEIVYTVSRPRPAPPGNLRRTAP